MAWITTLLVLLMVETFLTNSVPITTTTTTTTTRPPTKHCGKTLMAHSYRREFRYPTYGNSNSSWYCQLTPRSSNRFNELHLTINGDSDGNRNCESAYVNVYDGLVTTMWTLLGNVCGTTQRTFKTSGKYMTIISHNMPFSASYYTTKKAATTTASPFRWPTTTTASPFRWPTTTTASPFRWPTTTTASPFRWRTTTTASPFRWPTTIPFWWQTTTTASPFRWPTTIPIWWQTTTTTSPFRWPTTTTASPFRWPTTTPLRRETTPVDCGEWKRADPGLSYLRPSYGALRCEWTIYVNNDHSHVKLDVYDILPSGAYIDVYDGTGRKKRRLGRVTEIGLNDNVIFKSTGRFLTVIFHSTVPMNRIIAQYHQITDLGRGKVTMPPTQHSELCGNSAFKAKSKDQSFSTPSMHMYPGDRVNCKWVIKPGFYQETLHLEIDASLISQCNFKMTIITDHDNESYSFDECKSTSITSMNSITVLYSAYATEELSLESLEIEFYQDTPTDTSHSALVIGGGCGFALSIVIIPILILRMSQVYRRIISRRAASRVIQRSSNQSPRRPVNSANTNSVTLSVGDLVYLIQEPNATERETRPNPVQPEPRLPAYEANDAPPRYEDLEGAVAPPVSFKDKDLLIKNEIMQ